MLIELFSSSCCVVFVKTAIKELLSYKAQKIIAHSAAIPLKERDPAVKTALTQVA